MRRLLFVANVDWFFLSHRLPLALAAKEVGFDVHVAATASGVEGEIEGHGLGFHPISVYRGGSHLLRDLSLLISLIRLYRRLKPDIVHQITSKPVIYGSIAARIAKVAGIVNAIPGLGLVYTARGLRAKLRQFLVTLSYRLALPRARSRVIFQNVENRELFLNARLVLPGQDVLIRGSGVDTKEFIFTKEPAGIPVVVLASRMLRQKGVPEFVEASRLLARRNVEARMLLVGRVDEESPDHLSAQELETWAAEGTVEWVGHRSDMSRVIRDSHIIALPTAYGEGVPRILIEAAASARPIVTTDIPGCDDIVRDGINGILIPPKDSTALAGALERLISDEELRRTMGSHGRALVEREFDVSAVVEQTMRVYEELSAEISG